MKAALSSPTSRLLIGLAVTLAAVAVFSLYALSQIAGLRDLAARHGLPLGITGIAPLIYLGFKNDQPLETQTYWSQEMLGRGYLLGGAIYATYAYTPEIIDRFLADYRNDTSQLRVTVLPTLQCNFACDYCFQGDHGDYNRHAARMSPDTAASVARWIEERLDNVRPETLTLTFFGGEPLLNLPVMYDLAERASAIFCHSPMLNSCPSSNHLPRGVS